MKKQWPKKRVWEGWSMPSIWNELNLKLTYGKIYPEQVKTKITNSQYKSGKRRIVIEIEGEE